MSLCWIGMQRDVLNVLSVLARSFDKLSHPIDSLAYAFTRPPGCFQIWGLVYSCYVHIVVSATAFTAAAFSVNLLVKHLPPPADCLQSLLCQLPLKSKFKTPVCLPVAYTPSLQTCRCCLCLLTSLASTQEPPGPAQ